MGYCFMSIDKINNKNKNKLISSYKHNYRTITVPNADPNMKDQNEELVSLNGRTYTEAVQDRIDSLDYYKTHSFRSNGVLAYEIVTTFSREDREEIDIEKWKQKNIEWLRKTFNENPEKYGDNVLSVMYHADEAGNVHCHCLVTPVDGEGRFNASHYTPSPLSMSKLQDSYAEAMEEFGLKRGLKDSPASHQTIKEYYTDLNHEAAKELPADRDAAEREYKKVVMQNYYYKNRIERLELEGGKKDLDERIEYNKEKQELAEEKESFEKERDEFREKFGDEKTIEAKLNTVDLLNEGLKIYPDRDFANETLSNMEIIIDYNKEEREKKKKRGKQESETKAADDKTKGINSGGNGWFQRKKR